MKKTLAFWFLFLFFFESMSQSDEGFATYYQTRDRVIKANVLPIPLGGGSVSYEIVTGHRHSGEGGISFRHGRSTYLWNNPSAKQTSVAFFLKMNAYFSGHLDPPEGFYGFIYLKYAYHNVFFYYENILKDIYRNEVDVRTSTIGGGFGYQKLLHERFIAGIYGGAGFNPTMTIYVQSATYPPGLEADIFSQSTYIFDLFGGATVGYTF